MKHVWRGLGIAALVIGYPVLMHYTNVAATPAGHASGVATAPTSSAAHAGALVAIAPIVLIAAILAWRSSWRYWLLGLVILLCVGLWAIWPALLLHFGVVYWLQHVGMQIMLMVVFGRTLMAGEVPLCTHFARIVHQQNLLTPKHEWYARQVTLAWAIFFALIAVTSTLLFFLTSLATWSTFSNLVTLPLALLMFMIEYLIRRRVLRHVPHAPMIAGLRAYMSSNNRRP